MVAVYGNNDGAELRSRLPLVVPETVDEVGHREQLGGGDVLHRLPPRP